MLDPGTTIGTYEILGAIGAGAMGEVYRARDTRLGRVVALKLLSKTVLPDHERLARFRREAQILASLNHPHITAVYGLEQAGGELAIALELVDGEGLETRLARGPIAIDEALTIARQIAEGSIARLHRARTLWRPLATLHPPAQRAQRSADRRGPKVPMRPSSLQTEAPSHSLPTAA